MLDNFKANGKRVTGLFSKNETTVRKYVYFFRFYSEKSTNIVKQIIYFLQT